MIRRALFAVLIGLLAVLGSAAPAYADDSAPVEDLRVDVVLDERGQALVTMDFVMDFSQVSGRGPYLEWPLRQVSDDPSKWIVFTYSRPSLYSDTGARTDLYVDETTSNVLWRIGHEQVVYSQPQHYRIQFRMQGMVVANHPESKLDEFNWNPFTDWESTLSNVVVRISGPSDVTRAACWTGNDYDIPCPAKVEHGSAVIEAGTLAPGTKLQVVAGFPVGTMPGVALTYSDRATLKSNLTPGFGTGGLVGGVSLAVIVGTLVAHRRMKRDQVFLGMTPGQMPPEGMSAPRGFADINKLPIAVQFHPPKGATPGEIGTLVDAQADGIDVTATIIDLAVRGYIRIIPLKKNDFRLERLVRDTSKLHKFEASLLESIFRRSSARTMRQLRDKSFHSVMTKARNALYQQMVNRRWFKSNPAQAGLWWGIGAVAAAVGGVFVAVMLWETSQALVSIPLFLLAIGMLILAGDAHQRTAEGSAMLVQARGFELYLRKAEADQIQFEENVDIFSRYLPYAMIFGVADRWAKIFARLEQEGRYHTTSSWLVTDSYLSAYYYSSLMDQFSRSFTDSISAAQASHAAAQATSGSSGGSGFSGGGGFGGGGGGSW